MISFEDNRNILKSNSKRFRFKTLSQKESIFDISGCNRTIKTEVSWNMINISFNYINLHNKILM